MSVAPNNSSAPRFPASTLMAVVTLGLLALVAYHNSFSTPFVFDDEAAITNNPGIRHLWPLREVLFPAAQNGLDGGATSSGRPVVNLSLAINYALSGERVWSYHAFNFLVHFGAGCLLFGIIRRTLNRPALQARFGAHAAPLALAIAALWLLHPLQTESVTYTVQRAESLMGFLYLLTLYAFICRVEPDASQGWSVLCVSACALGMATKEVMATAPLMLFLYDRTFVAGTFHEAWRRRGKFYATLASTWIVLGAVLLGTSSNRGGTVGFNLGIPEWMYGLTQLQAVTRYLALSVWPQPLVFEYGLFSISNLMQVLPYAVLIGVLAFSTVIALWRRPMLGFLGVWFFAILLPSSLVPNVVQMIVEHRMYLSLAAVMTLLVLGLYTWLGVRSLFLWIAVAVAFTTLTMRRNHDYRSEIALWADTVAKRPDNAIAQHNLGHAYALAGRFAEAVPFYAETIRLRTSEAGSLSPSTDEVIRGRLVYVEAHSNLGNAVAQLGRSADAIHEYEEALRLRPNYLTARYNLATALAEAGKTPEAIAQYEILLQASPREAELHYDLGVALGRAGRTDDAMQHYAEAVRLNPRYAKAHNNWGNLLAGRGRPAEAMAQYEAALQVMPDYAEAEINLANILVQLNRTEEAIGHYQAALRLTPDSVAAHYNLGNAWLRLNRLTEAKEQFSQAVQLQPTSPGAQHNLALTLVRLGHADEAVLHYEKALQQMPGSAQIHLNLALALEQLGRIPEAIAHDREALRLEPGLTEAREQLARLQ